MCPRQWPIRILVLRPIDKRVTSTVLWSRRLGCRGPVPLLRVAELWNFKSKQAEPHPELRVIGPLL